MIYLIVAAPFILVSLLVGAVVLIADHVLPESD